MIDLDKIKLDAVRANTGPWRTWEDLKHLVTQDTGEDSVVSERVIVNDDAAYPYDLYHIANCDPDTIIALVRVVESAKLACNAYRSKDNGVGIPAIRIIEMEKALEPFQQKQGGGDDAQI